MSLALEPIFIKTRYFQRKDAKYPELDDHTQVHGHKGYVLLPGEEIELFLAVSGTYKHMGRFFSMDSGMFFDKNDAHVHAIDKTAGITVEPMTYQDVMGQPVRLKFVDEPFVTFCDKTCGVLTSDEVNQLYPEASGV